VIGLNWKWITLMLTAPLPVALLVAYPVWRAGQFILANLAGSGVIFATALALIFREHAELAALTSRCLDAGYTCWPEPGAFTRFAIYAGIGLADVVVLFLLSLRVESRLRNRAYAPEWRR
jgi:hypothetical protein